MASAPVRPTLLVDLDGTITDSLPGIAASYRSALASVGVEEDPTSDIRLIAGPPMSESLQAAGLDDKQLAAALLAYRRRYDAIGWTENAVYPGMAELLSRLAAQGYRMAVATSKPEVAARRILDYFDLSQYFEFVGGADWQVGRQDKASVIAHSLAALDIEAVPATAGGTGEVLMIGDRAHDVEGAAHFGIPCAIVRWGYGSPREWDTARWSAGDVSELERIICGW